ncbi:hypothetical protein BN8_03801 [Fibrisoma limi BUZ 3]|uniref:Uncharacterized protein n=1 Tax=Fibrisoma limi BUZ 3 TaxID=1185876 RepID=I2GL35_9BACT|nr:hypothetical protein BN8_03801 [Fibrisoma limi BUZ 3]
MQNFRKKSKTANFPPQKMAKSGQNLRHIFLPFILSFLKPLIINNTTYA